MNKRSSRCARHFDYDINSNKKREEEEVEAIANVFYRRIITVRRG